MKNKNDTSIQILFLASALFWLVGGIWRLIEELSIISGYRVVILIMCVLMIINGIVLLLLGLVFRKNIKWITNFAIFYIAINFILSFTDQLGLIDLAVILINLSLLVLLIRGNMNKKTIKENEDKERLI